MLAVGALAAVAVASDCGSGACVPRFDSGAAPPRRVSSCPRGGVPPGGPSLPVLPVVLVVLRPVLVLPLRGAEDELHRDDLHPIVLRRRDRAGVRVAQRL